jgi:hypothetical protein
MKEPIQQSGNEVSIVIYDAPLPPRYLKFSKKFIRTLFVVVPVSLGLIFLTLLFIGLGSRVKDTPAPSLPTVLTDEDSKITALETEVKALQESNKQLQDKLSGQGTVDPTTAEEPFLMGIKKPYGMQNFLSENRVNLDQFELVQDNNKTALKFQIISTNPETRVAGHVLVFMISASGLMAYPPEANAAIGGGVKFSMGEPFAVSRLRPTNAEFALHLTGESVKFVIYIFSREGDLLLIKETESFKVGAKS